jgi:hypothetical protein
LKIPFGNSELAALGVRVRVATIIAISSRLKESSDGFDFVYAQNYPKITFNNDCRNQNNFSSIQL